MLASTETHHASISVNIHRWISIVGLLLIFGSANTAAETSVTYRQRTLAVLDLLCDGFTDAAVKSAFPGVRLGAREDVTRGTTVLGWRQRIEFIDASHAVAERVVVNDKPRRLSVQYSDHQSLPVLLVLATPDCAITNARSIQYDNGLAVYIHQLDQQLDPRGERIPMNPPWPAGEDAGGVTVALIDSGVNYLLPAIEKHLARDARHRPLGFDFWDMDPRPFDSHPVRSPFFPQRHGTRIASIILREAPGTRLIPYRYPRPDMRRMHQLITDAAEAGARVVNLSLGGNKQDQWTSFEKIARQHTGMLFVVSAGNNGRDIDRHPVYPASLDLDNMLTVTSADLDGYPARGSNWGRIGVDLLVPGENIPATGFDGIGRDVSGSSYAAARVTALASRILLNAPELSARLLREKILSMAEPAPDSFTSGGWISEPDDLAREHDLQSVRVIASTDWTGSDQAHDQFRPTLVILNNSGWNVHRVQEMVERSADILRQCDIDLAPEKLLEVAAADGLRDFSRSNAKLLITKIGAAGPHVFFVRDTLDRPAFEAVTFGTTNSTRNPDLRFTIWMTAETQDPHIALAHELTHLLLDEGSHTRTPNNLMRSDTSPENIELSEMQCNAMRSTAKRNGLLG